ncbi:MAG: hypothetical protein A2941_01925 [Candidatus Yanofskybacteria bacterium RIFCSPLOWO2_01_FULL_49_17]|uniref:DUF86 domain-containing protein n=1 Tax=Candidatus Yanofskybacteria bacterium RIFCSPLOWO2_01_FULL_49_17 TaxID=1802700 RepID=A0A1F8GS78_9BACT|nr:MAG: hypothetical protein A2941_01925 [Candidatus Yanofskybacteria bacterium RIFCSPLOWO2_01_FULL_49_17]
MDKDSIYIEEIKDFCHKVIDFTKDISFQKFAGDEKLQLAVLKLLENIGEASKRISEETRDKYPNTSWRKAAAMRDRLVHDYMDIDLEIVFDVAVHEIPLLLHSLKITNLYQ